MKMPALSKFGAPFWAATAFLLANIIIVLINVFVPRFVNQPDIRIADFKINIDEEEFAIPSHERRLLREAYLGRGVCADEYRQGRIPISCVDAVKNIVTEGIEEYERRVDSSKTHIAFVESLKDPSIDIERAVLQVEEEFSPSEIMFLEMQLKLIDFAAERYKTFAHEWIVDMWTAIFLEEREEEEEILKILRNHRELLQNGRIQAQGVDESTIVEIVVMNAGRADSLIYPTGTLSFSQSEVQLVRIREPSQWRRADEQKHAAYEIIKAGEFARLFYVASKQFSVNAKYSRFQSLMSGLSSENYLITLRSADGQHALSREVVPNLISFEVEYRDEAGAVYY